MAFWGVEVKPGNPFTLGANGVSGRLHISQATLGIGSAMTKSIVQCNVGSKRPVFLCSLFPEKTESAQLNLEFEEAVEVVFSVIGPRSVHLTGYYLGGRHYPRDDDSESYGEDIAETETERSNDEDEYEDSFINDDDPEVLPPSPISDNTVQEISDRDKSKEWKGRRRRLKKKYQPSESDKEGSLQPHNVLDDKTVSHASESEDEEGFFISTLLKKKSAPKCTNDIQEMNLEVELDDTKRKPKWNNNVIVESSRNFCPVTVGSEPKSVGPGISRKMKRKRKEQLEKSPSKVDKADHRNRLKENQLEKEKVISDGMTHTIDTREQTQNVASDEDAGQLNGFFLPSDGMVAENGLKRKKKKHKKEQNNHQVEEKPENAISDLVRDVNPLQKENLAVGAQEFADVENPGKKDIKKKKKKSKDQHSDVGLNDVDVLSPDERAFLDAKTSGRNADSHGRRLANGMKIEELDLGNPDGRTVAPGKKVSVHYVGKFMENGRVFDSNIGGEPLKFRIGAGKFGKAWDDGLDGMHVGGKRRLTIPPPVSNAIKGTTKDLPSDSWLVYDVEVVRIR